MIPACLAGGLTSSLLSMGRFRAMLAFGCGLVCACGSPQSDDEVTMAPGPAEVRLGFLKDGEYVRLEMGSEAPVIWGFQGGTWTMPVLRTRGIASPTTLEASLTLMEGERLGESEVVDELSMTKDDWLETDRFSIPVQHAPPNQYESIADVYGQSAVIEVTVLDGAERTAELSVEVVLVEGS